MTRANGKFLMCLFGALKNDALKMRIIRMYEYKPFAIHGCSFGKRNGARLIPETNIIDRQLIIFKEGVRIAPHPRLLRINKCCYSPARFRGESVSEFNFSGIIWSARPDLTCCG